MKNFIKLIWLTPFMILSNRIPFKKMFSLSRQPVLAKLNRKTDAHLGYQATIGNPNSPGFFSYSYISSRNKSKGFSIGDYTKIGNEFTLISECRIEIGSRCLIGNKVKIFDSDFHATTKDRKCENSVCSEVKIGNNVFIGDNVIILKGVSIGDDSVIGAGSVVTKSIGCSEIVAGNPAKKISMVQ